MEFSESIFNADPNLGPWEDYKISPKDRTVYPKSIYRVEGLTEGAENLTFSGGQEKAAFLKSDDASITLDFGFNTCGFFSIEIGGEVGSEVDSALLQLSFAESSLFVDKNESDRSMDFLIDDRNLTIPARKGTYTAPFEKQRGAFRYLTISTNKCKGGIEIKKVATKMNCMPSLGEDLRNYSGYFHCSDEFANKIWYAGAYTVQLATIPTDSGRTIDYVMPPTGWSNKDKCGFGEEVLTDGARRDRSVWSGDRFITQTSESIAFNSKSSFNGVEWMLAFQTGEGEFPYACPPIHIYGSDTYNLWTLIDIYDVYLRLGMKGSKWFREKAWVQWLKCVDYALLKIDGTGLMEVTRPLDWGRPVLSGHPLSLNCILFRCLQLTKELAIYEFGNEKLAEKYAAAEKALKESVNIVLWDPAKGMYFDSDDSKVHSQDGNSLAALFGVAEDQSKLDSISHGLSLNWNEFGAVNVESGGMISPFQSSIELYAHAAAGHPERTLALFKLMWGYIWNSPYSVQSSLIEGYFKDGTCKYPFTLYDPSYISHAHPWSSGPTTAFTYDIVGLTITNADHSNWSLKPKGVYADGSWEFGQTGFTSNLRGFISAGWKKHESSLELAIKAPENMTGDIWVPVKHEGYSIQLDGEKVSPTLVTDDYAVLRDVGPGNHTIILQYE